MPQSQVDGDELTDGGAICDAMCATADLLRPVVTMLTTMLIVDITVFGLPQHKSQISYQIKQCQQNGQQSL